MYTPLMHTAPAGSGSHITLKDQKVTMTKITVNPVAVPKLSEQQHHTMKSLKWYRSKSLPQQCQRVPCTVSVTRASSVCLNCSLASICSRRLRSTLSAIVLYCVACCSACANCPCKSASHTKSFANVSSMYILRSNFPKMCSYDNEKL